MKKLILALTLMIQILTIDITLPLSQKNFKTLQTPGNHDIFASSLLLPQLQNFFSLPENEIYISPSDNSIHAKLQNIKIDGSCRHEINCLNNKFDGTLQKGSYLSGKVKINFHEIKIMAAAELDAKIDISTDVRVRVGQRFFGHCPQLARKTVGINVASEGKVGIGLELVAKDAKILKIDDKWFLSFKFLVNIYGTVTGWKTDDIHVHNCKIKILGIQIASVCGFIERKLKSKINQIVQKAENIQVPSIIKKLEDKIKAKIGDEIRIPLSFLPENINTFEM